MSQTVEQKVVSRIYGNGRGWSFSPKDFSDLGTRSSIDVALHRLITKETIVTLREWLPEELRPKVIKDTGLVTGWIREAILDICRRES